MPKKDAAKPANPAFEETGLMEDSTVKAAYELLTRHAGASTRTIGDAILFGKLLGTFAPEENPSVIAAGLLQAGLQARVGGGWECFWKTKSLPMTCDEK